MPFRVTASDITTEVLGTHFNVNTYGDKDPVLTTLLEGSVRAQLGAQHIMLRSVRLCMVNAGVIQLSHNVGIEKVMAWKHNSFYFRNDNIETIMNQLSGWYDVEVV